MPLSCPALEVRIDLVQLQKPRIAGIQTGELQSLPLRVECVFFGFRKSAREAGATLARFSLRGPFPIFTGGTVCSTGVDLPYKAIRSLGRLPV